jgi:hypothetical protein
VNYLSFHNTSFALRYFLMQMARPQCDKSLVGVGEGMYCYQGLVPMTSDVFHPGLPPLWVHEVKVPFPLSKLKSSSRWFEWFRCIRTNSTNSLIKKFLRRTTKITWDSQGVGSCSWWRSPKVHWVFWPKVSTTLKRWEGATISWPSLFVFVPVAKFLKFSKCEILMVKLENNAFSIIVRN